MLLAASALAVIFAPARATPPAPATVEPRSAYVDDRACAGCHATQYGRWSGSHHARAMQRASAATVLGDFGGATFIHRGTRWRFFTRDGAFFVNAQGPDGAPGDFAVEYTIGVEPLQQYLVALPGGRLQALTVAWDVKRRRWFSLDAAAKAAPGTPLHWSGRYQNWNLMCAECHVTNLRKGYVLETDAYETTWDAPNVGCQACHGPGGTHVAWAKTGTGGADPGRFDGSARAEVDGCAHCHSRRVRLVDREQPGRPLLDEFRPEGLRAGLYHPDGQQLGEVYEYGSFRQSAMYDRGVRCTDCHDPHAGTLRATGNAICTRCHGARPDARFPTLRARTYDSPAHHFHRPGSAGARCVSCHMPARTYMVVDPRRDHSFPVPRPDLSLKTGAPNACTTCHRNRGDEWAAAAIRRWYGPDASRRPHHASAIAAGRAGARGAAPALRALAANGSAPAIVRATALELLRGYGAAGIPAMIAATADSDPVVRAAAVGGLDRAAPAARIASAVPLLRDPIRAVRIEAAQVLVGMPRELLRDADWQALDAAVRELIDSHLAMADMPSARANLGVLQERLGRPELALRSYKVAVAMDPSLVAARVNLAALLEGAGRGADATAALREGLAATPDSGELHYALGLVLAQRGYLPDAASELESAARLLPRRARVHYNYGLTLEQLGRTANAEAALLRAWSLDPDDPDIVYALARFRLRQGRYERAAVLARRLEAMAPGHPGARAILDRTAGAGR